MSFGFRVRDFHDQPLSPEDRATVAGLGIAERKRMVDDLHIPLDGFQKAKEFIRSHHFPVTGAPHDVGKFHLLLGEWRSGKSWPVIHYEQEVNEARGSRDVHPVVHVTCGEGWGAKQVLIAIGTAITGNPVSERYGMRLLTSLVVNLLKQFKVELIVIDELNEVMSKGKGQQSSLLLSSLRAILDQRLCNVIGVGEPWIYKTVKTNHGYLGGRGGLLNHTVRSQDWHSTEGMENYMVFLNNVDARLPFPKPSGIGIPKYAAHFYDLSKGSIGYTMSYVAAAAFMALDAGSAKIEHDHLVAMGVEARGPKDTFTHFVDQLEPKLVGRRDAKK